MGCAICLEEYEADNANPALQAVALRCGHIFHQKCIQEWLSSRASAKERCCAMCKAPSDFEQYARSVQAAAAPNAAVPSNEYVVLYPAEMEEIDKFLQQRNAHVARCREIQRRREAVGGAGAGADDEAEQKREEEQLGLLLDFRMHLNAFVMGVYRENSKTVDFAALKLIREVGLLKGDEGTAALKDSIAALNKLHKKLYERYQRTKLETERLRQAAASHEAQLSQRVQAATEHERTAHRKLRALDKREKDLDARQIELGAEAQRAQGEAQTLALKRRELEEQYQETKRMRVETQQALAMKEQRLKAECDERLGAMQREVDEAREACATDERARIHAEQEREAAVAKSLRLAKQLAPLTRTLEEVRRKKDEYKAAVEAAKLPLREEILTLKKKLALATSGASQASASGSSSSSNNAKVARKASSFSRSSRAPEDATTSVEMEWDQSSFSNNSNSLARAQRQADASHAKARASFTSAKARSSFNSSSASAAAGNESSLIVEAEDLSSEFNGIHDAFRPPPVAVPRSALRNSIVNANSNTHANASASGSGSGSKLQPAKVGKIISPLKKRNSPSKAASPAKLSALRRAPEFNNEAEAQLDPSPSAGLIFQSRTSSSSAAASRYVAEMGAGGQPSSSLQAPHKRRRVHEADGECVYTGASSSSSSAQQQQKQKQRAQNDKAASFFSPASSASASVADDDLPDAKDALAKVFLDMRKDREEGERDAGLGRRATSGLAVLGPKRKVRNAGWVPS